MTEYYIGVMSGTSVDAVDTVLCQINHHGHVKHLYSYSLTFPKQLASRLHAAMRPEFTSLPALKELEADYSSHVIAAVHGLLNTAAVAPSVVTAIGCHGQTLWHQPPSNTNPGSAPFSFQLINASLIALRTGIDVIYDFRQKDIIAGGQGAPLVPAFHFHALSAQCPQHTAVINLGGIANITFLGRTEAEVIGFDTGPANTLIDAYFRQQWGVPGFDQGGRTATSGDVIDSLFRTLMTAPYFSRKPPKSTGREQFNLDWLSPYLDGNEKPEDVLRTLLEVTTESIAQSFEFLPHPPQHLVVCGGGVYNPLLLDRLAQRVAPVTVTTSAHYQLDPQAIEAMAFAWLGWCYEQKKPGNLCAVTGADHPVVLGSKVYAN